VLVGGTFVVRNEQLVENVFVGKPVVSDRAVASKLRAGR
jgi:hypothetical protein